MISCISYDNIHEHEMAFAAQFKLRHKSFLVRQSYSVQSYNNQEYDAYDNPSAIYLVYYKDRRAYGVSRLNPASHCSMLKEIYPEMVKDHSIFANSMVWEGTRFCIDNDLEPALRNQISKELVAGYFEFALTQDIKKIIGMMPTFILRSIFAKNGCLYEPLGEIKHIDNMRIQAACMNITGSHYAHFKHISGLTKKVIDDAQISQAYKKAA